MDHIPCARQLGYVECHLPVGHIDMHVALRPTPEGDFVEVSWADEYEGLALQPWMQSLPCEQDEGLIPIHVYGPGTAANMAWTKS